MQLLQLTCLWSASIFSSLELRLLAMIVIMCLPFTCAARLGKPDRSGMTKTGRPLTTTDSESKEKVTAQPARGSPDFQLPREVNKYLNRWKLSKPVLFFLTLLCMPNVVDGAQSERDLPVTWAKDSAEARGLLFPGTYIMEPACKSIVGYLRNLWEHLSTGAPIEVQGEMVKTSSTRSRTFV